MSDPHREDCRRLHRLIGHYLAMQAWIRKLDCIVLTRADLEKFLGLSKFKSARVKWLTSDLEPWFPHQVPYYKSGAPSSIHSLFLSRVPIQPHLPKGTMTTQTRIQKLPPTAPPTGLLSKGIYRVPSEERMITYSALLSAGLRKP
jgi:hypothetical protein